jgi:hypothetical protein
VPPTDLSTEEYRLWAIDVPSVNRWLYWAALKAASASEIPQSECRAWELKDGEICFFGKPGYVKWVTSDPGPEFLKWFERLHGPYAPRRGILALRMADLAGFGAMLVFLWLAARLVLRSDMLATLAVLPICMVHYWVTCIAFVSGSGDIFMMAGFAAALYLWLKYHLASEGASWRSVAVVAATLGLAMSAKHQAVVVLAAFAAYLFLYARGWRRLVAPAAAAAVAFAVFLFLNPVVLAHPDAGPLRVLAMMVARRGEVVAEAQSRIPRQGLSEIWNLDFYWLPFLPVAAAAFLAMRRERWVAPLLLWCASITLSSAFGLATIRYFQRNYLAPLEMSLYFTLALAALALVKAHLSPADAVPREAAHA